MKSQPTNTKIKKTIKFEEVCLLCPNEPIIGLIDFSKGGTHTALCEKHLITFAKNLLKDENDNPNTKKITAVRPIVLFGKTLFILIYGDSDRLDLLWNILKKYEK